MKKVLTVMLVIATVLGAVSCSKKGSGTSEGNPEEAELRVAMVTDSADITDQSFNQITYETCKAFAEKHGLDFQYYKPSGETKEARVASINQAIQDGYNTVFLPGFLFAEALFQVADMNSDVYFVGLDISEGDVLGVAQTAGKPDWKLPPNCFCAVYEEHLSGFMAGYAAVKEGFTHLGFLGGIAVPPVTRFGYGFVQGVDAAAKEMGNADQVTVEYIYGGQFYGDSVITAAMDSWYQQRNVEVVFACGGGIFTSACEAAAKVGKRVIGVDVDQTSHINKYGEGMHLTSAMKGLGATVTTVLTAIHNGQWSRYSGKFESLGLTSPEIDNSESPNFVQLPTTTWTMQNFTLDGYKTLVADLYNGKYSVSNSTDAMPTTEVTVNAYPNIK